VGRRTFQELPESLARCGETCAELNVDDLGIDFNDNNKKPYSTNDARVRELERQVRELQEQMERMKKENGKD
jgi:polyhydroxyalkanoate synthesis regulator phasin